MFSLIMTCYDWFFSFNGKIHGVNSNGKAIDGSEPPVDAKPILDSTSPGNTLAGGDTEQERRMIRTGPRCYVLWCPIFTLWLFNIAMENGPFIDGLPIKNGDFPWLC